MVLEVMGRFAGWIAAHAGISGGGDVILIPEIPFRYEACVRKGPRPASARASTSRSSSCRRRAREHGKDYVTPGSAEKNREARLGGIGAVVAAEIQQRTGRETRVCVLGHLQRGGAPTSFDRILCTRFGARAVQLIAEGEIRPHGRAETARYCRGQDFRCYRPSAHRPARR